jgi:hypothetical protein
VRTTATKPAIQSGKTSPLSAGDAAQLAAWYACYALDRLADDPGRFHPGVRSHLAAAYVEHEAAAKALGLEHDPFTNDGHGEGWPVGGSRA